MDFKMKRIIFSVMFICFSTSLWAEETAYGTAGCGLGSMIMGNKDGQVLAATTNGTSYTQLFGITSGTSNCKDVAKATALNGFIRDNKVALANNIARGEGAELNSVLAMLNCNQNELAAKELQKNYSEIFSSYYEQHIAHKMATVLNADPLLSQSCQIPSVLL